MEGIVSRDSDALQVSCFCTCCLRRSALRDAPCSHLWPWQVGYMQPLITHAVGARACTCCSRARLHRPSFMRHHAAQTAAEAHQHHGRGLV